jgi:hypothetical protein
MTDQQRLKANLERLRVAYAEIHDCVIDGLFTAQVRDELLTVIHDQVRRLESALHPPTIKATLSVGGEDVGSVQPVTGDPVADLEAAKRAAMKMTQREDEKRKQKPEGEQ